MKEYMEISPEAGIFHTLAGMCPGERGRPEPLWIKTDVRKFAFLVHPASVRSNASLYVRSYAANYSIRRSELGAGAPLTLFSDPRCEKALGKAVLNGRYYEPAQRSDWSLKKNIDKDHCDVIDVDMDLTEEEFQYLKMGFLPEEFEGKFVIYVDNDKFYYGRSWLSVVAFEAPVLRPAPGRYRFEKVYATIEMNIRASAKADHFRSIVRQQIERI